MANATEKAEPAQRRELKRDGRGRFVYVFEASGRGQHLVGGFRVEAKGMNGHVVLLTCRNLRQYSLWSDGMPGAKQE